MTRVERDERNRRKLLRIVRSVRRRWRLRVFLRGAAVTLAAAFAAFFLSSFGIDRFRFDEGAVLAFRIVTWAAVAGAAWWTLLRPLLRRIPDERVALYLEEHEPSLEAALLTAVEAVEEDGSGASASPALRRRLVERAAEACREVEDGRRVERAALRRATGWLAGVTTLVVAVTLAGPAFLGQAGPLLLRPWATADAASPYAIDVDPGNVRVPRGGDQKVSAGLRGFEAAVVELAVRREEGAAWERRPMTRAAETGRFEAFLFDLQEPAEYLVEAAGVRSPLFRIEVADLPYAERIDLEYRFPAYTGLPPRTVEDGGDVVVLRGTEVELSVTPTIPTPAGRIIFDDSAAVPLEPGAAGRLGGSFRVDRETFYRIELRGPDGGWVRGSADYLVEPLDDQPPAVTVTEPGRDRSVTPIDELFVEVEAEDDYGVGLLELRYAVNGGDEETVVLHRGGGGETGSLLRGHTLFLEEMDLEPGDLVAYHARAVDRNEVGGSQTAVSDIYFLEIRPFDRRFRQADQAPAPGGGGGAGMGGELSEQQKQIVAGTFNLVRDAEEYAADRMSENLATLALTQGRLRERVEELVRQMRMRGVAADSVFRTIAAELPRAAEAMGEAEERLGGRDPEGALPAEQRALRHLQRAEAAYREVQLSMQRGGAGGAGGAAEAEELADLFELELDKLRNQYEQLQRGERRERDAEVDAALQRLQELARRQQQQNERLRRERGTPGDGGGGAAQSRLADEAEELARRLERLSREETRPELGESARRLREAAERMRRASARGEGGEAQGAEALDRLQEARRALETRQTAALEREVEDAARRAERIAADQREIAADVEELPGPGEDEGRRRSRLRNLSERKDALAGEVEALESDLDRMSRELQREQPEAGRALRRAAETIRDKKLTEKIRYSKGVIGGRSGEYARNFEEQITADAEELREAVEEAREAFGASDPRPLERTAEEARDLVRGLESLRERIRQVAEQVPPGAEDAGRPGGDRPGDEAGEGNAEEGMGEGGEPGEGAAGEGRRRGEGEEGAKGEQGGQGRPAGEGQGGGEPGGAGRPSGRPESGGPGAPGGGRGRLSPEDVRQFRREFQQRREDAEQLRRRMEGTGLSAEELSEAIRLLRELDEGRVYDDLEEIERLQEQVLRGLKEFEFALRRRLGGPGAEKLFLSGSDEVPEEYRELVEEYYRALSEEGGEPPP